MINYTPNFQDALESLYKILQEIRYDWICRSLKGLSYFADSSLSGFPSAINEQLATLNLSYSAAFRLFRLGQFVPYSEIESLISRDLLTSLVKLGLIVEENNSIRLDDYTIISWLGFYIISTNPIIKPQTNLSAEQYRLASELMSTSGTLAIDLNSGCGLAALVAAKRFDKVLAFSPNEEALNVTLANAALNGLSEKVFSIKELPESTELSKTDLIFASETNIPLPENIEKLFNHTNSIEVLSKLIDRCPTSSKIIKQFIGEENIEPIAVYLQNQLVKNNHKVKLFVLSRSYISPLYLEALAQIIGYQLDDKTISASQIHKDLVEFYENKSARCIYLALITTSANETESLEIINLASDLTSQDILEIPADIELVEKDLLKLKVEQTSLEIQIDEVQKTIIELLDKDILLKEIAEEIAQKYNLSVDIAGAKTLEFCHQLFSQGLLSSHSVSALRGQLRLMTINANKFANTLKTIGEELDSKGYKS